MTDAIDRHRRSGRNGWIFRLVGNIRDRIEIGRVRRRLSAFDDNLLKDIGISRGDIDRVVRHGREPGAANKRSPSLRPVLRRLEP